MHGHTHEDSHGHLAERKVLMTHSERHKYVGTSIITSTVELIAAAASGNMAAIVDGSHGVGEVFIGNHQIKNAHNSDAVEYARRKRIYTAISGISTMAGITAVVELQTGHNFGQHSAAIEAAVLGSALLSAANAYRATIGIVRRAKQKYGPLRKAHREHRITANDEDVLMHIPLHDAPISTIALGSTAVKFAGNYLGYKSTGNVNTVENILGVMSGAWGAWLFLPTKKNLAHSHPESDAADR